MALISSNKVYDWSKYTATVFLPALNLFWLAIAAIWHLPLAQEVSGSLAALNALLGALVGISSVQHQAGK